MTATHSRTAAIAGMVLGGLLILPAAAGADTPAPALFAEPSLEADELVRHRAKGATAGSLSAVISETQTVSEQTGANTVGPASFIGASGLFTVIQNTGNNVIIQTRTDVTVNFLSLSLSLP